MRAAAIVVSEQTTETRSQAKDQADKSFTSHPGLTRRRAESSRAGRVPRGGFRGKGTVPLGKGLSRLDSRPLPLPTRPRWASGKLVGLFMRDELRPLAVQD